MLSFDAPQNPAHILLLILVFTAAAFDLRYRRIPNWLVAAGAIGGLIVNFYLASWRGLGMAALGLIVAFGVYFVLYILRAMGGGDVKLMAAVGAIVGPANWFALFVFTAIIGGVIALLSLIWKGRLASGVRNVGHIASQLVRGRAPHRSRPDLDIASSKALTLPHGVAIALGTLVFLWAQ